MNMTPIRPTSMLLMEGSTIVTFGIDPDHATPMHKARLLDCGASLMARLVDTLLDWNDRVRTRRQLAGLTEAELKDIGLSHSDVMIESSKPFWRF